MADYKISLGIDVDVSDIQSQINTKAGKLDKIPIKVEIENLKELKSQIQDLGKDNKNALTLDTSSIEKSLDRLSNTITDIKASLGALDSKSGMKSLLSSVNQIATALGKVENESDNLVKSLSALSKKDFSINFDLKMGKSASQISSEQGDIKRDAISQLKQQAKALEDYLDQYYKVAQRQEGVVKLTQGTNLFSSFWEMSSSIGDTKASLKQQVSTYKQYIDLMQEAAKIKGIDLSSVTSGFSKTTNDIVEGTKNVANGAEEVKQALKGIFGGGLDIEGLAGQLQPIITDLNEIKTAIQSLSSNNSIDGLTQSFNRLSETLEKLTSNLTLAKNTLDTGFSNASPANNAVKAAQQTGQKIGETISKAAKQSINLDDVIDEQVLKLMNEYAITGGKGSKAFDEIRQSLVDFRNGSGDINKITSAISNNMKVVNEAKNDYKDLAEHIKLVNASGAKIHIPDSIRQEYGDDYKSMRSRLGRAFTSGQGMDFESFIEETNSILGQTIDLSHGAEAAFRDLFNKINSTKAPKFLTGDDLFRSGILDMGDVVANVSTSLEQIENVEEKIARTSTTSGTGFESVKNDLREIAIEADNTSDAIQSMRNAMSSMKFNNSSIDAVTKDLEEMNITIKDVAAKEKNGVIDITVKGVNEAKEAVTVVKRLNDETGNFDVISTKISKPFDEGTEAAKRFKKEAELVENIKFDFEVGKYDDGLSKMEVNYNKLSSASKELRENVEQVRNAYRELELAYEGTGDEVADKERLIQAEKEYAKALQTTNNLIRVQARTERADSDRLKLDDDIKLFQADIDKWLVNNSAATKKFGSQMLDLKAKAEGVDRVTLNGLIRQFKLADKQAEKLGLKTQSVGDKIKTKFKEYASYLSAAEMFMYAEQAFRSMFEQVKLIDSAMTELKKVTDETNESYNRFLTNAASRAKEIGTTIDGLVSSTADFARLGYGFKDAQGLAEVANIYAVVGDEIEGVEGATESLISTMAAFKDEMNGLSNSDFALSIVDKLNEVANNYSISSGGLGEALQRSASSLATGNNTLDESISLITAANEVVQNPEKVGNAMKTISMRIRSAKSEMEEMGEDTDGMVESTATLRAEIKALSGVDIMASATEFKSTYQILDELSEKWEDLNDISRATIIEKMAGKHQGNVFASLMENFDTARDALETSLNSSGSAMAEHEKWSQSLEAQLLKLQAAWQGLSQAFLSSDFLKVAFDFIIKLVDGITLLIDKVGVLPTLFTGFAIFKSFGNNGLFKTINNDLDGFINKIGVANKSFADLINAFNTGKSVGGLKGGLSAIKNLLSNGLTKSDIANIQAYNNEIENGVSAQTAWYRTMQTSSKSAQDLVASANGGKVALTRMKTATIGAKVALIGAKVAAIAFNAALTMGISLLIDWAISGIMKVANAKKELAEEVDELTSKFKEQHDELQKLKGDYDTTNESSMISKYEKLSKGVDNLGRNVSLTADEYSEYQSIVNTIADQFPSLIAGYDSQGNAILSCKDNVEDLVAAYENLIETQNNEIFANAGKIGKDFANTVDDNEDSGFWNGKLTSKGIKGLEEILNNDYTEDEIKEYFSRAYNEDGKGTVKQIAKALEDAGVDGLFSLFGVYSTDNVAEVLSKVKETNPDILTSIIKDFKVGLEKDIEEMKSIAQATLSDAFDISDSKYYDMSDTMQNVVKQIVNGFDYEFYKDYKDDPLGVKTYINNMLEQLNTLSDSDSATVEAAFDLQTQFNGGDISYGEYVKGLEDTGKLIEKLNLEPELESQLKLSLGLNEEGIVESFDKLKKRLASEEYFNAMPSDYISFIEGLSNDEISVLWSIIPELEKSDYKETISDIKAALEREMMLQGLSFELNLEVEAAGIESLNTALTESVTASGLSSESISALKGRYADLESQGYDLSSMFEETSHGVHLNRQEFNKLEKAYATQKLNEVTGQLDEMQVAYDQLGEDIRNCTDPVEKSKLFSDRQLLAQRISEAATLASQYQGLTSAYNDWLAAEEAGQERDMYENVIKGFETIDDEISRGWLDDGTIEFLELLTGKNLSTAGIEKQKEAYDRLSKTIKNTSYSIRDFFTVDEDGNSTNAGVYNFLDAIGQLEEEKFGGKDVVKRDKDGNIISFDFELAGGDEAIAEALGVSEEIVQIMVRAADDAGFVVSLDGAYRQLADLQNEAKSAADYLHKIGKTDFEFDFNTSSVKDLKDQLTEAHKILDSKEFWNEDGTFNFNADGATEAMQIVSTLQAKLDKLTEDQYGIGLTVEEEKFEEPLENLQEYGHTIQKLNQLKLNPETNSDEIEKLNGELDDIAEYFANLDGDLKVDLGFEADDGIDEVKKKIENGEVKIPTVLDIQANMDKNIEDLRDLMLLNSGLLSEEQEKAIKIKLGIEVEADKVDTSDVDEKVDKAIGRSSKGYSSETVRKQNIEIIAKTMGVEDIDDLTSKLKGLDDKTIQVIAEVLGRTDVDSLKYTLDNLGAEDKLQLQVIAEAIGKGDVEGLQTAIGKLSPKTVEAIAKALGYDKVEDLKSAVANMDGNTVQAVAQALGLSDVNTLQITVNNMQGNTVDAGVDTSGQKEKIDTLQGQIDGMRGNTVTITTVIKTVYEGVKKAVKSGASAGKKLREKRFGTVDFSEVNGTANVNGTTGRAYKQGSWGTKTSGTALVGELGREVLVRDGKYYTIGDNGAEFIHYKQGDIIFNHKQSDELFKYGRVTAGGGRGKAFVEGTAFSKGVGGIGKVVHEVAIDATGSSSGKPKTTTKTTTTTTSSPSIGSKGNGGLSGGVGKVDGNGVGTEEGVSKFEETVDWIEIAIDRIERAIDKLDKKANNIYKNWSSRNNALLNQISEVNEEISLQQQAKNKYMAAANGVGLDEIYARKVREGRIDFDKITDEVTADKIKSYQKW